jgi:hypothetical protein
MMQSKSQYELFREGLDKIGQVRRAWFTTFNLDIHFFERFIFPLLTGKDFTQMQTPQDYESLSKSLDYSGEPADGRLELHLFYDYRKLEVSTQAKLTTVQIHPVNIASISEPKKNWFAGGIFHPKVALLENTEGALWLMAGSGNLTLSGWSRNSECLAFEPIVSTTTARPVYHFFYALFRHIQNKNIVDAHPLIRRLRYGRGFRSKHNNISYSDWTFLSSMEDSTLLEQLSHAKNKNQDLFVWSPYFDARLDDLLNHIPGSLGKIHLIPAPNHLGRIGISEATFEKLKNKDSIQLMEDGSRAPEQFTHAKIWLCGNILAIGSWNCTRAGLNLKSAPRNMEAGIIYRLADDQAIELAHLSLKLTLLANPAFSTEKELEDDLKSLLEDYTFALPLVLDWKELKIRMEGSVSSATRKKIFELGNVVLLPGLGRCNPSDLNEGIDVRNATTFLLKDRLYTFESSDGKILYRGYLLESGLENRPVQGFRDLDDFLSGWIMGRPENQTFRHSLNYKTDSGLADDFSEQTDAIFSTGFRNTWFAAFMAFDKIASRIIQVNRSGLPKEQKSLEYIRIGRVIPGNLTELRRHLQFVLDACLIKEKEIRISKVYLWFLIEKANAVFGLFNTESKMQDEMLEAIDHSKLDSELLKINAGKGKGVKKWKAFITSELNNWEWNV